MGKVIIYTQIDADAFVIEGLCDYKSDSTSQILSRDTCVPQTKFTPSVHSQERQFGPQMLVCSL